MPKITEHFTAEEFACKCCGVTAMNLEFVKKLERIRVRAGVPIRVVSGYRCKKHNDEVGGKPDSAHLRGVAIDGGCEDSRSRWLLINAAIQEGVNRIGIAKTFVHLDDDATLPQEVVWLY